MSESCLWPCQAEKRLAAIQNLEQPAVMRSATVADARASGCSEVRHVGEYRASGRNEVRHGGRRPSERLLGRLPPWRTPERAAARRSTTWVSTERAAARRSATWVSTERAAVMRSATVADARASGCSGLSTVADRLAAGGIHRRMVKCAAPAASSPRSHARIRRTAARTPSPAMPDSIPCRQSPLSRSSWSMCARSTPHWNVRRGVYPAVDWRKSPGECLPTRAERPLLAANSTR